MIISLQFVSAFSELESFSSEQSRKKWTEEDGKFCSGIPLISPSFKTEDIEEDKEEFKGGCLSKLLDIFFFFFKKGFWVTWSQEQALKMKRVLDSKLLDKV